MCIGIDVRHVWDCCWYLIAACIGTVGVVVLFVGVLHSSDDVRYVDVVGCICIGI